MTYRSAPDRSQGPIVAVVGVVTLAVVAAIVFFLFTAETQPPTGAGSPTQAPTAAPTATPTPLPTDAPLDEALLNERLTVLLLGTDVNAQREAAGEPVNTDALMVVSIGPGQEEVTIISLPRDTVDIPLPDGGLWTDKVNAILREAGMETLVGAVETLFGVPIDAHLKLDMDDFAALVDAAGGIEVQVEQTLDDPPIDLHLEPGTQQVDGATAVKYVRTRVDGDYERQERQQEVVLALMRRLVEEETAVNLPQLLGGLESLETDLPLDELPTLVEIARRAQDASVTQQVLRPPEFIVFEGDRGDGRGYILQPNVEAIRAHAAETIGE